MTQALTKFDQAKQAIERAHSVDEVKDILSKSHAIQAYARQAKDRELELNAAIIRHRSERRLGQLLNKGGRGQGEHGQRPEPTIEELGIDKTLSARSRQVADMSDAEFEQALEMLREHVRDASDTPKYSLSKIEEVHRRARTAPERNIPPTYGPNRYSIITSDPPWDISRHIPYPTLTDKQLIEEYKPPHQEAAWLYLWSIQSTVPRALAVMEGWGAMYQSMIIWEKSGVGFGGINYYGRPIYNCELILVGCWGRPRTMPFMPVWIYAESTPLHSEKPAKFYKYLRGTTRGPRLDQFARKQHPGFDAWGNEVGYKIWRG